MKYLVLFLCLVAPVSVLGQSVDTLSLNEIIVTASKVHTTEKQTTKPVTVITVAQLERYAGSDLGQILQQQNGLQINGAWSNPGKDEAVYLRGASTQYTLILIDGYPVSDPSSEGGAFDPRLIPVNNIERIEIVKGSMSTLYGSDAIAGVINIITRKPNDQKMNVSGSASYGSFNSQKYALGFRGDVNGYGYSVNVARRDIGGISEASAPENVSFDKDGFVHNALSAQLKLPLFKGFTLEPLVTASAYDGQYDGGAFTDANNTYEAKFVNAGTRFDYVRENYLVKGALTYTDTDRKFTDAYGIFNPTAPIVEHRCVWSV